MFGIPQCLIYLIISSLEYLHIRNAFKSNGVFSWTIFSSRGSYINSYFPLRRVRFLFGYEGFIVNHIIRIVCCIALFFVNDYAIKTTLLSFLAISSLILSYRNVIGNDGSDQMNSIICMTLAIAFLSKNIFVFKTGLVFIACQSIVSYMIAGIAKLLSTKWRAGIAIYQIMNTKTYGNQKIALYLSKAPKLVCYILSWKIIGVETMFFMVVFMPYPWFFLFLAWGFLFHIYNAITMGLNNFFWAFMATYPSIIYLHYLIAKII